MSAGRDVAPRVTAERLSAEFGGGAGGQLRIAYVEEGTA